MGEYTLIDNFKRGLLGTANAIRIWIMMGYYYAFVPEHIHRTREGKVECMRFSWGSFAPEFGLKLLYHTGTTDGDDNHEKAQIDFAFIWGKFYLTMPWTHLPKYSDQPYCDSDSYGFTFVHDEADKCAMLYFRNRCKLYDMPHRLTQVKYEVKNKDGLWVADPKGSGFSEFTDKHAHKTTHDYSYTLRSGEVQHRKATIYQERRTCRWYWFQWLPINAAVFTNIDVWFDGEVGERSGSWKGGTLGCGYRMKPKETPYETLRRMERERKF